MISDNKIDENWIKIFFEEAMKWENLEYAYNTIKMFIHSETENGVDIKHFLHNCNEIFSKMELEQFSISRIIAWGATVSISHGKVWIKDSVECLTALLSSLLINKMAINSSSEEEFMNCLYICTQEGALGNIHIIDVASMKKECMQYYEIAYQDYRKYVEKNKQKNLEISTKITDGFRNLAVKMKKLEELPENMQVIRVNILGEQESQIFDSEYDCDSKNVIREITEQEMASYIFLVEDEIYIVDVDDPW